MDKCSPQRTEREPHGGHVQRHPALPCPECKMRGKGGGARIGNHRRSCATCNNFAQTVMRLTRKRLIEKYADEYQMMRYRAEVDLYPQVIENFNEVYPYAEAQQQAEQQEQERGQTE